VSVSVSIPTPLRSYAGGQSRVTVECRSVGDALDELARRYPNLRQHLFSESGELRSFVNVYLNDANVRDLRGAETVVAEGDTLTIVPSIAGGAAQRVTRR
jgi:MoaD family protein